MEHHLDSNKESRQGAASGPCLRERRMFRLLLHSNANYFGTAADSLLPVKRPIRCNRYYEEISCVAWDREAHLMAALVTLHQPDGYAAGTRLTRAPEHLRFYVSLDGGQEWRDQGSASVEVENAPCDGDRHYAVSLEPLLSAEELHGVEVMLRVILAWEDFPPPEDPEWKPVFGDVHEVVFPTSETTDSDERGALLAAGLSGVDGGAMLAVVRLTRDDIESRNYRYLSFWLEPEGGNRLDRCLGSVALSHERTEQLLRLPLDLLDCRWACAESGLSLGVRLVLSGAPLKEPAVVAENDKAFRMAKACLTVPPTVTAGAGQIALVAGRSAREIHVAELSLDELEDSEIFIQGVPMPDHDYIVEVSDDGLRWRPLLNSFTVMDRWGNRIRHRPDGRSGQFRFLPHEQNVLGILARWDVPEPGKWQVRLRVYMQGVLLPESDLVVVRVGKSAARQMVDAVEEDSDSTGSVIPRDLVLGSLLPGTGLVSM